MATFSQVDSIFDVPPQQWNALLQTDYPFARHEFLAALEGSGSVAPDRGWQPAHGLLHDAQGTLVAAAPLYLKDNSFGEFVFDFAWADAYARLGLPYYPKLICAIPFTPVIGPRLLARSSADRQTLAGALAQLPRRLGVSSIHSLFGSHDSATAMLHAGAHRRRGIQYLWYNRGYADFNEFLSTLTAKRRKEIRRERRRIHDAGITVEVQPAGALPAALQDTLYQFYNRTYLIRGQTPYLDPAFFSQLVEHMPEQTLFFIARQAGRAVAMAFMMRDGHTLYGRHWGCEADYHSLHFETCYYSGIEYAIRHGLDRFDAGAQGEHKLRRGFEPAATWSTHTLADSRLSQAVENFVTREAELVADYEQQQWAHCSYHENH